MILLVALLISKSWLIWLNIEWTLQHCINSASWLWDKMTAKSCPMFLHHTILLCGFTLRVFQTDCSSLKHIKLLWLYCKSVQFAATAKITVRVHLNSMHLVQTLDTHPCIDLLARDWQVLNAWGERQCVSLMTSILWNTMEGKGRGVKGEGWLEHLLKVAVLNKEFHVTHIIANNWNDLLILDVLILDVLSVWSNHALKLWRKLII